MRCGECDERPKRSERDGAKERKKQEKERLAFSVLVPESVSLALIDLASRKLASLFVCCVTTHFCLPKSERKLTVLFAFIALAQPQPLGILLVFVAH